jgi:hypothetical protein
MCADYMRGAYSGARFDGSTAGKVAAAFAAGRNPRSRVDGENGKSTGGTKKRRRTELHACARQRAGVDAACPLRVSVASLLL